MTDNQEKTYTPEQIERAIEAVLFAAGYPVPVKQLSQAMEIGEDMLNEAVDGMISHYAERGIQLIRVGEAIQLCTREEHEGLIRTVLGIKGGGTLSPSMTEVLAIIAYHQPVTRAFIEQVRGVDSSYALNMLSEKHLIESVGRLEVPGRPMLYATTEDFLRCFGIQDLTELPQVEIAEGTAQPLPPPTSGTGSAAE